MGIGDQEKCSVQSETSSCGHSQMRGVDFQDVYSPVVNDVTVRMLLLKMLVDKADCILVDIQTAFLHGELGAGEEIYMDCPEGMVHIEDECLVLLKTIY